MNLTNGEIFNAKEPLQKLMEVKLPVKASYDVAKLANKLNEQLKVIGDVRTGLIKTYGKPNPENSQEISVDPQGEGFAKFAEEMDTLLAQEVEVVFDKVKLPEKVAATCDKCDHNMDKAFEIEPSVLMALEKFIEVG